MAVVGIKNLDEIERNLRKLGGEVCKEILAEAMEAAGEVYRQAIEAATPTGPDKSGQKWRHKGHAKNEVLVYTPIRLRSLTEMRRLIGWSKDAFYMLFVDQGWRFSRKRLRRSSATAEYYARKTHGQAGVAWGGRKVGGQKILERVFNTVSGSAGQRAIDVMRSAFQRKVA